METFLEAPTIEVAINSPTAPLPDRTMRLIDLIVQTAPLRKHIDYNNKMRAKLIADEHEAVGLTILADCIRVRAGLLKRSHFDRKATRAERNVIIERIRDILTECEQIRPDDLAADLDMPRRTLDGITGYMKRNGMLRTVRQKWYQLVPPAEQVA